jgi:hypothetical protein
LIKKVRENLPKKYNVSKYSRTWNLDEWLRVMNLISADLKHDKRAIDYIEKKAEEFYGKGAIVPYGRLLDIYYFEGK